MPPPSPTSASACRGWADVTALDPLRLTARDAKRLLVDGEISSAELAKVYLDQIGAVESRVRA